MDGLTATLWAMALAILGAPFWIIPRVPRKAHVVVVVWGGGAFFLACSFYFLVTGFAGGVEQQLEAATAQLKEANIELELLPVETLGKDWGIAVLWLTVLYMGALRFWDWLMTSD